MRMESAVVYSYDPSASSIQLVKGEYGKNRCIDHFVIHKTVCKGGTIAYGQIYCLIF